MNTGVSRKKRNSVASHTMAGIPPITPTTITASPTGRLATPSDSCPITTPPPMRKPISHNAGRAAPASDRIQSHA